MRKVCSPIPPEDCSGCEYFTGGHMVSDVLNVHCMLGLLIGFFM